MRGGKSCRLRWKNYLRPNIKHGGMSKEEEDIIIRMHNLIGNRWSLIAGRLPGRTDNYVKNYWHTFEQEQFSSKQEKIQRSRESDEEEEEAEDEGSSTNLQREKKNRERGKHREDGGRRNRVFYNKSMDRQRNREISDRDSISIDDEDRRSFWVR